MGLWMCLAYSKINPDGLVHKKVYSHLFVGRFGLLGPFPTLIAVSCLWQLTYSAFTLLTNVESPRS